VQESKEMLMKKLRAKLNALAEKYSKQESTIEKGS